MICHFKFGYSSRVIEFMERPIPYFLLKNEEVVVGNSIMYCDIERVLNGKTFSFSLFSCILSEECDDIDTLKQQIINDLTENQDEID